MQVLHTVLLKDLLLQNPKETSFAFTLAQAYTQIGEFQIGVNLYNKLLEEMPSEQSEIIIKYISNQEQNKLEEIGITTNKNMIPGDTLSPKETSGLRIGFAAVTTRGCAKEDAIKIAKLIHMFLSNNISKEDAKLSKKEYKQKLAKRKYPSSAYELAAQIQEKTNQEVRITVPGHMQRGGSPCAYDRVLSTRLGAAAADLILNKEYGYMVGIKNDKTVKVPLEEGRCISYMCHVSSIRRVPAHCMHSFNKYVWKTFSKYLDKGFINSY